MSFTRHLTVAKTSVSLPALRMIGVLFCGIEGQYGGGMAHLATSMVPDGQQVAFASGDGVLPRSTKSYPKDGI
jgi:hypothetical protein